MNRGITKKKKKGFSASGPFVSVCDRLVRVAPQAPMRFS